MSKKYILAIDQSTSASKVMLFSHKAGLVGKVTIPHRQYYPQPGFVEHDGEEIFSNVLLGIRKIMLDISVDAGEVEALAITNQRETSIVWDRTTGSPIAPAAVWQCQRGKDFCNQLKEKGLEPMIHKKTGLLADPYFSAGKFRWILDHTPGAREKAEKGDLLLGTMDSWLVWKLTGGKVHATDTTNACRTMLFNLHTLTWDEELLDLFGLSPTLLPEVHFSDEVVGYTHESILPGVPIAGLTGDSHAAFFGQNCFLPGMAKATFGTGSSIMIHTGAKPLTAPQGLVTSIGYGCRDEVAFVFEGNIHCTGDTISWLKNELGLIASAAETEELARSVEGNNGVYLVPAFVGLGAPHWDNHARATISGMARNTNRAHIVRAALESIAYQVKDLTDLMEKPGTVSLRELRVDGGPTENRFLMQFLADLLNHEVKRPAIGEISALGAAFAAGMATGFWKNREEIQTLYQADSTYYPAMRAEASRKLCEGWYQAVARTRWQPAAITSNKENRYL